MDSIGGNKKTAFLLLLVLTITVLFVLYAATGDISQTTSLPQHIVHKVVNSFISGVSGWGLQDSKTETPNPTIIGDYEEIAPYGKKDNNSGTIEESHISEEFSKLFPARSTRNLNESIILINSILEPFYAKIAEAAAVLNKSKTFSLSTKGPFQLADGYGSDYFSIVEKHSIVTLFLKTPRTVVDNIFDYSFFDYTSNNCERVEKKSVYGKGRGRELYNTTCQSNPKDSLRPRPLQDASLRVSLPDGFEQTKDSTTLTFLHVIQNAFVKSYGDIYINGLKIVPQRCSQDLNNKAPDSKSVKASRLYSEVLTIAQFWGGGFFHATVEQLTRLAPYIPFLQRNPHIKLHVDSKTGFLTEILKLVGLNPDRVVSGHINAKILYATASSACARPSAFTTHLISLWYRSMITTPPEARDSIIVVRRSPGKRRWFKHHDGIFRMVQKLGEERGLRVELFPDNPVPPLKRAVQMFSRALLVVAPHGAGLSNVFFSEPGTIIIEGLCYDGGSANMCYRNLAQLLGQRWFGVLLEEQCMNMHPADLENPLSFYLNTFIPRKTDQPGRK